MSWDNLINAVNQAKAKACIYNNHQLDQHWPKGKKPLKMSINSRN